MTPEEKARELIDGQLNQAGWEVVSRNEYLPGCTSAVKEALMRGNTESDYLLFVDDKAIAVVEAKRQENPLGEDVQSQAEEYANNPQDWYGLWDNNQIPLVYLANGNTIYFKNLREEGSVYVDLQKMHSPKEMLRLIGQPLGFRALPRLDKRGLRDCQYRAEIAFEKSIKNGKRKSLAILATGAGKTYLACLASYRFLNYTPIKRVLFLVDRNNLSRQTENAYNRFDRTETQNGLNSIYTIKKLIKNEDVSADIVISTIQKLYSVLTGQSILDNEDEEDERYNIENDMDTPIHIGGDLKLAQDHFQLIIIDECHRSIYGKWRSVLEYFSGAYILGLTATPTPEAYAFFNDNIIENYTYEQSIVDGVNVPSRVYRIQTQVTEHGGEIKAGTKLSETTRKTDEITSVIVQQPIDYQPNELDKTVRNPNQIKTVITAFKKAVYEDLFTDREKNWNYVPKTLIFAKDDNHASEIVRIVQEVFSEEFENHLLPIEFVQKITYKAGDSNNLISEFNTNKKFRIAVTVTLVATGTDVKPLEVVFFMKDVQSDVLYTQMKGRGCRAIEEDTLCEVTPNAKTKDCYYIIDAVGVTEHDKSIPVPTGDNGIETVRISLERLLEELAHKAVSDTNLKLLRDECASIHRRYENSRLFSRHLDQFIESFGFAPQSVAAKIQRAFDDNALPPYVSPSENNSIRMELIEDLIENLEARNKLLEMKKGYILNTQDPDELIFAGFSIETARTFIQNFEAYIDINKGRIEALRILYNSEDKLITHDMLIKMSDSFLSECPQYKPYHIWRNYKLLDEVGNVSELDPKYNLNALTHLIQLVRFAYHKTHRLTSLISGYVSRFNLYCGQEQRNLTKEQIVIMRQIAEYVVNDGAISNKELNEIDTDLWRKGINAFGSERLDAEIHAMSCIILKAA